MSLPVNERSGGFQSLNSGLPCRTNRFELGPASLPPPPTFPAPRSPQFPAPGPASFPAWRRARVWLGRLARRDRNNNGCNNKGEGGK